MMVSQLIEPSDGHPVAIETPEGVITIEWHRNGHRGKKKLKINLPGDMRAHKGVERALATKNARFLAMDNGKVKPTYSILRPVLEDGKLVGVEQPTVLRLQSQGDT